MTERRMYIGTLGPIIWDDTDLINDPDGYFSGQYYQAIVTDGDLNIDGSFVGTVELDDLDASHQLVLQWNEDDTNDRTLNFEVNAGNRTLDLSGNLIVESLSTLNQDLTTDASPTFAGIVLGISTKVNDYTTEGSDYTILADGTSNTVTISLDASATTGQIHNIKCIDDTFTVTVSRNGNNIDGVASDIILVKDEVVTLQADSSNNWWVI